MKYSSARAVFPYRALMSTTHEVSCFIAQSELQPYRFNSYSTRTSHFSSTFCNLAVPSVLELGTYSLSKLLSKGLQHTSSSFSLRLERAGQRDAVRVLLLAGVEIAGPLWHAL